MTFIFLCYCLLMQAKQRQLRTVMDIGPAFFFFKWSAAIFQALLLKKNQQLNFWRQWIRFVFIVKPTVYCFWSCKDLQFSFILWAPVGNGVICGYECRCSIYICKHVCLYCEYCTYSRSCAWTLILLLPLLYKFIGIIGPFQSKWDLFKDLPGGQPWWILRILTKMRRYRAKAGWGRTYKWKSECERKRENKLTKYEVIIITA